MDAAAAVVVAGERGKEAGPASIAAEAATVRNEVAAMAVVAAVVVVGWRTDGNSVAAWTGNKDRTRL